jgi:hypothetical protein
LDLEHAQIALGLVVVKRNGQVVQRSQPIPLRGSGPNRPLVAPQRAVT